MIIRTFNDALHTARQMAAQIAEDIQKTIEQRNFFSIAFTGGNSPAYYLSHLAMQSVDWNWVHIFWHNERIVSPDSQHSNYRLIQQYLLDHIMLPHSNIHRIMGELKSKAADDYIQGLNTFFKNNIQFDVALLGLNINGYIAPFYPKSKLLLNRSVNQAEFVENPFKPNSLRLGLSADIINRSKRLFLFVTGSDKRDVLKEFLELMNHPKKNRKYPKLDTEKLEIFTDIQI